MSKHDKKNGNKGLFRRLGMKAQTAEPTEEAKTALPEDEIAVSEEMKAEENLTASAELGAEDIGDDELKELFERYLGASASEGIVDDEMKELFDRYLGATASEETAEAASYDAVHQQILEAEERAGVATLPETDVEKNINEAEKYIDAITEQAEAPAGEDMTFADELMNEATGSFQMELQTTEQMDAFAPAAEEVPANDPMMHETRILDVQKTSEMPLPDMPTDTAMMKAFGLDPKTAELKRDENLFEEIRLSEGELETPAPIKEEPTAEAEAEWDAIAAKKKHTGYEYNDPSQNKEIFAAFKSKYNAAKIRMALAAMLAVLLGVLENFPGAADFVGGNLGFIAIDWILAIAAAALVFDRIVIAAKALAKFEFDSDSVTLASFAMSLIATGVSLFTAPTYADVYLYNLPFAICVFLTALNMFILVRQDVYSFKIISSQGTKKVLARTSLEENVPEKEAFADYIAENETICSIKKTDFIGDFFAHRSEKATSKFLLKVFIPECLVFALIAFLLSFFLFENPVGESFGTAYAAFMMSVPFTAFITYSYPVYLAARRAYSYNSAILGDKTHENYERTSVIVFRDEDAFPIGRAKVKSLKLYGDRKIENVMYYASSIYSVIGGPLASVFRQATLNSEVSSDIELREISEGGASAMIDGKHVVIGRPAYMESQCFETFFDEGDEEYEGKTNKRVFYLACDQIIIAKFYVQYTTTSDFLYMVHRLTNSGVSISIRTADPCLDTGILYANKMNPEEKPVKFVKGILAEEKCAEVSARTGGIVSIGTEKEIVKTFLVSDKIENVKKTNFVLKTVASILGVAVMLLVILTGHASEMRSIFPAIYQLFWLLPIYVISKIYI